MGFGVWGQPRTHLLRQPRDVEEQELLRQDKVLRQLQAMLIVADKHVSLVVTGNGDVVEPEDGMIAIPDGPGLGINVNMDVVEEYAT